MNFHLFVQAPTTNTTSPHISNSRIPPHLSGTTDLNTRPWNPGRPLCQRQDDCFGWEVRTDYLAYDGLRFKCGTTDLNTRPWNPGGSFFLRWGIWLHCQAQASYLSPARVCSSFQGWHAGPRHAAMESRWVAAFKDATSCRVACKSMSLISYFEGVTVALTTRPWASGAF